MPAFETLLPLERDLKNLTAQERAIFRKVVTEAFVPDLAAPDRPFRPGLRVKGVTAHPGVFEMTWDNGPALGDELLGEQQRTQVPYCWGAMGQ
ncbi:MAG: hypothetical protein ACLP5E_14885 [Streptosporangiaceae bacterium]